MSDNSAIAAMPGVTRSKTTRRPLLTFFAAALTLGACVTRGDAQVDLMDGPWQQIESNAGACPQCRIVIEQGGSSLIVTSNNGWSASITQDASANRATGVGRWGTGLTGAMAGKPFHVDFALKDQRLTMSMLVEMENGSRRRIRGVFGRVWFGA